MPSPEKTPIDIRFDGLFLVSFDSQQKIFKAMINTEAKGHTLTIVVRKFTHGKTGGGLKCRRSKPIIVQRERIKTLDPIRIFIGEGDEPIPKGNSAKVKRGFLQKILDLEGVQFYDRKLDFNRGNYATTVFLLNGDVDGTEDVCGAYRVKEKVFKRLKPHFTSRKWNELIASEQANDPKSIIRLDEFSGDSKARVEINKSQKLWALSGNKGAPLFEPLEPLGPGESYELIIQYLDETKPLPIAECEGFAHHCRALTLVPKEPEEREEREPIYCIFRPTIKREKYGSTMTSTDAGVCINAQIGSESA